MDESYDRIVRDCERIGSTAAITSPRNPEKARSCATANSCCKQTACARARRDSMIRQAETACLPPSGKMPEVRREHLLRAKKLGFSDRQLAVANDATESEIRAIRKSLGITPDLPPRGYVRGGV